MMILRSGQPHEWHARLAPIVARLALGTNLDGTNVDLLQRAEVAAAEIVHTEAARNGWLGEPAALDFSTDLRTLEESLRAAQELKGLIFELSALPSPSLDEQQLLADVHKRVTSLGEHAEDRVRTIENCAAQAKLIDLSLEEKREGARIAEKRAELSGRMAAAIYGIDSTQIVPTSPAADKIEGLVAAYQDIKHTLGGA